MTIEERIADAIILDLRAAIEEAITAYGLLTRDHVRAMVILTEEVGEAAAEVLEMTRAHTTGEREAREAAIAELSQVAAVAVMMIANLRSEQ